MAFLIMMTTFLFVINANTTSAITLNCTFSIVIPAYVGEIYHCMGKSMDGNGEKLIAVSGTHLFGKGNTDVQGLTASNNALAFIPVNIEEFFPNILYFDFSLNKISYVNSSHLVPFPNLMRLNLNSNQITELDSNLFSSSKSIKFINFSNNMLKHIGHDFILPEVGEALFSTNPCIDKNAVNRDQLTALRFSLLLYCPPTISQIEATLENRSNLITKTNDQMQSLISEVQDLVTKTEKLELNQLEIHLDILKSLSELEKRVTLLESTNNNKSAIKIDDN